MHVEGDLKCDTPDFLILPLEFPFCLQVGYMNTSKNISDMRSTTPCL